HLPARRRSGGEFPYRAKPAPAPAAFVGNRGTILEAVGPQESSPKYLVFGSRHLRALHAGALEHADHLSPFAWPARQRMAFAPQMGCGMRRAQMSRAPHAANRGCHGILSLLLAACLCAFAAQAHAASYYVVVAGLGGEPDYVQRFTADANELDRVFKASGDTAHVFTLSGAQSTAAQLRSTLSTVAAQAKADDDFTLILIGHCSWDGADYKFNLVGPDLTATEIAAMCDRIAARRQLVVDATSASGGAVQAFERPGRAVIAATKSGTEKNATVFARYWLEALQDPSTDTDKSESINAMEAFTYASRKTAEFYESQKRLATEHAVFND